jgi:hypothetical protein
MKTDVHGTSACQPGQEQFEYFRHGKRRFVQYDYRTMTGELFTGVFPSLDNARETRQTWEGQHS